MPDTYHGAGGQVDVGRAFAQIEGDNVGGIKDQTIRTKGTDAVAFVEADGVDSLGQRV